MGLMSLYRRKVVESSSSTTCKGEAGPSVARAGFSLKSVFFFFIQPQSQRATLVELLWVYFPFLKLGLARLSKLLWNLGMKILHKCAKQHYYISSDLLLWNFAKGRGEEATVESSSAERSCKQMVFAYRMCYPSATVLQRSSFLMIAGGLNSGYIWSS